MTRQLTELEDAIASLEIYIQTVQFSSDEDARRVSIRLYRSAKRIFALAEQASPQDQHK
jgi:hypothetical protein